MFIHMAMSKSPSPAWGTILKSNSNGTYFIVSQEYVNRDDRGYVDFEKMIGLDGIALINIVSNPIEAILSGQKKLQSRITHNDGEFPAVFLSWFNRRPMQEALGNPYSRQPSIRKEMNILVAVLCVIILLTVISLMRCSGLFFTCPWLHRSPRPQSHIQQPLNYWCDYGCWQRRQIPCALYRK